MADHAGSFGQVAAAYEQGRPGYPEELVAWVGSHRAEPAGLVADLGAGTGKLTRLLAPLGERLVAIEPLAEMRALLAELVPDAVVLAARADALPLRSGSIDLLTCAQAFHWFATGEVVDELARVLAPGGQLLLVWNEHRPTHPAHRRAIELEAEHRPTGVADAELGGWRDAFKSGAPLQAFDEAGFDYEQLVDRAGFLARVASMSVVSSLPDAERQRVLGELAALVDRDVVGLTYETRAYAFRSP